MDSETTVEGLFESAHEDEVLSQTSLGILTNFDIGQEVQNAMGIDIDDVDAVETVLIGGLIDDSGSINMNGNASVVREGLNMVTDAVTASANKEGVLMHVKYLNGTVLYPFCKIENIIKLDGNNYDPRGGTPLYDKCVSFLGTILAKAQEFADAAVPSRTISLIITDGADIHSTENTAADVKSIVEDMLRQENHIVAAMGIEDGYTDFKQVFSDMGIPDDWILTPGNDPSEIRAAFNIFSQASQSAASGGAAFSTTSSAGLGGFGN